MSPRNRRRKPVSIKEEKQEEEQKKSMPVSSTFNYSSRRSEEAFNVGRHEEGKRVNKEDKGPYKIKRIIILIISVIVIIFIYRLLHISSNPEIVPVYPSGQATLAISNLKPYQSSANKLFSSFWNKNKITVNATDIESKLKAQFPNLESVSVSISLFHPNAKVYIEPALPSFILRTTENTYYSLDINGRAIAEASSLGSLKTNNNAVVNDNSGLNVKLNTQVLPSSDITFMETVIAELNAKSISVSSFTLPPSSQELDTYIAGQTYYVKFNLQENDAREQAGTYLATIKLLKSENITPSKYVDVRVDGRSYYE